MRSGWYMDKRRPLIDKEMGLIQERSSGMMMQFHNTSLPEQYTHAWLRVHPGNVLELQWYNEDRQEVCLSVQQKMYLRKVRDGKFQFHEREYTL